MYHIDIQSLRCDKKTAVKMFSMDSYLINIQQVNETQRMELLID
jgi:hypothetical protein